jgi:predicted ribosome quality control (RQC) complex YloA/Tae2 family protein
MHVMILYIPLVKAEVTFHIGRHAQDNEEVIHASDPDDLWFHAVGGPSSHVVARMASVGAVNKKQRHKIMVQGALLCKQHSKNKSDRKVEVMVAPIRHVKTREPGGKVGSVTVEQYQTVHV